MGKEVGWRGRLRRAGGGDFEGEFEGEFAGGDLRGGG